MAKTFEETGAIPYAGDLRYEKVVDNINSIIKKLSSNFQSRNELHHNMKTLVNGSGTLEIAKTLCRLA